MYELNNTQNHVYLLDKYSVYTCIHNLSGLVVNPLCVWACIALSVEPTQWPTLFYFIPYYITSLSHLITLLRGHFWRTTCHPSGSRFFNSYVLTSFITSHFWGSDLFKIHLLLQALWSSTIFEVTYFKIHPVWINNKIHWKNKQLAVILNVCDSLCHSLHLIVKQSSLIWTEDICLSFHAFVHYRKTTCILHINSYMIIFTYCILMMIDKVYKLISIRLIKT